MRPTDPELCRVLTDLQAGFGSGQVEVISVRRAVPRLSGLLRAGLLPANGAPTADARQAALDLDGIAAKWGEVRRSLHAL